MTPTNQTLRIISLTLQIIIWLMTNKCVIRNRTQKSKFISWSFLIRDEHSRYAGSQRFTLDTLGNDPFQKSYTWLSE